MHTAMNYELKLCACGATPTLIPHFVHGSANRLNYKVKCKKCYTETKWRRKAQDAVSEWNGEKEDK
jgi:hypothetical protein